MGWSHPHSGWAHSQNSRNALIDGKFVSMVILSTVKLTVKMTHQTDMIKNLLWEVLGLPCDFLGRWWWGDIL